MENASNPNGLQPQRIGMLTVILRSCCTGIATLVVGAFVWLLITMFVAARSIATTGTGGVEVGWDLVTMLHNLSVKQLVIPSALFAAGFGLGFKYFSRSLKS
jgi:hypothetical protein